MKELLYSVYVKYYNNVLLKRKDSQIFPYVLNWVEHFLWLKQSVLHILYFPYVTAPFIHRVVTSIDN